MTLVYGVVALSCFLSSTATDVNVGVSAPPAGSYFFQTFYHTSFLPLLLVTFIMAWFSRPSTDEAIPAGFRKFQVAYLLVWGVCVAADWLQGPYVYALYSAYGFAPHEIAQLFVAGFGSSLAFGCVVGTVADRFGRKFSCLAYCVFYIVSCLTKHCKNYHILMFGRITGGIATSMLFSCFECWLVSEHLTRHRFSSGLLSYMFGLMFTSMYCVAIVAGLVAQTAADAFPLTPISSSSIIHVGGYCAPFDLAIMCNVIGMALIGLLWGENYGDSDEEEESSTGMVDKFRSAMGLLYTSKNMLLLCCVVASFEGSMYAFVFNWTPALDSKTTPPPHGLIFALFMMACMIGASVSTIVGGKIKANTILISAILLSIAAFVILTIAVGTPDHLMISFACFLLFEFGCGLYFPSVGVLKSQVVPEHVRGTMYNIYRVPLNAVVVGLLLSNVSMLRCFMLCASLLMVALFSLCRITTEQDHPKGIDEEQSALLGETKKAVKDA